jgi:hypothetical protein
VLLRGGPYDGRKVDGRRGGALMVRLADKPGYLAEYRPAKDKGIYEFVRLVPFEPPHEAKTRQSSHSLS